MFTPIKTLKIILKKLALIFLVYFLFPLYFTSYQVKSYSFERKIVNCCFSTCINYNLS